MPLNAHASIVHIHLSCQYHNRVYMYLYIEEIQLYWVITVHIFISKEQFLPKSEDDGAVKECLLPQSQRWSYPSHCRGVPTMTHTVKLLPNYQRSGLKFNRTVPFVNDDLLTLSIYNIVTVYGIFFIVHSLHSTQSISQAHLKFKGCKRMLMCLMLAHNALY